jgi:hypothetical protein
MIEGRVICPFRAKVIGETIEVTRLAWPNSGYGMLAECRRKGSAYRADINSLEWIEPLPEGYEWIAAYQAWRERNN